MDTFLYIKTFVACLLPAREPADLAVGAELLWEAEVVQVLLDHLGDEGTAGFEEGGVSG